MDHLKLDKNLVNAVKNLTKEEKNKWFGCLKVDNNFYKYIKIGLIQKLVSHFNIHDNVVELKSKSDLIPGVYEGGFKIWESTQDMIQFVNENDLIQANLKILDLGCGGGLVGINALKKGSNTVHFQDFNHNVLRWFTIPNIILNMISENEENSSKVENYIQSACQFMAGDWSLIEKLIVNNGLKYDLILSCETIYNSDNYSKLLKVIENSLATDGKVLIAAKSYYFGVGGGVDQFVHFVNQNSVFDCSIVKTIDSPLERNILKLTFSQL